MYNGKVNKKQNQKKDIKKEDIKKEDIKKEENDYHKKLPFHEFKFPKGYLTPEISSDLKHAKIAFKTMNGIYYNKSIEWGNKKEYMKPQLEEFEKYMNKWIKEVVESFNREPLDVFNSTKKIYNKTEEVENKE